MIPAYRSAVVSVRVFCRGKPCQPDCLSRLRRAASLMADGARPCPTPSCACAGGGGAGPASLFSRLLRGARALLFSACVSLACSGYVECRWSGQSWNCSGEGDSIYVYDGSAGGDIYPVATNLWGKCTNCVDMTPAYVVEWKQTAARHLDEASESITNAIHLVHEARLVLDDFEGFFNLADVDVPWNSTANPTSNQCVQVRSSFPFGGSPFVQVKDLIDSSLGWSYDSSSFRTMGERNAFARWVAAYNAVIGFIQSVVAPRVQNISMEYLERAEDELAFSADKVSAVRANVSLLSSDPCAGSDDAPPTNNVAGAGMNWCTYEQGAAIIKALVDIRDLAGKLETYARSQLDYTRRIYSVLRDVAYTAYTNVPEETDWLNVYFDGQDTEWGYAATNLSHRLELLLYGLAVGYTNKVESVDDETGIDPSNTNRYFSVSNSLDSARRDIGQSSLLVNEQAVSIFDSLTRFFARFSGGQKLESQVVVPEVTVRFGESAVKIDSVRFADDSIGATVQTMCRYFCSSVYWLGAFFCGVFFWRWFLSLVFSYLRFLHDLVQSLFND